MSVLTPGSWQLRVLTTEYILDANSLIEESLKQVQASSAFGDVYHISLSADTVLSGFRDPRLHPRVAGARSIILRVPLLVGIGQQSVAMVELRRLVELVFWTVYFSDHPVEWRAFAATSGSGFSQDTRKPISYMAHRELSYYIEYARELMGEEPSGLGAEAVEAIKQVSHELNAAVHPGQIAQLVGRKAPHEDVSDSSLRKFSRRQRRVFSSCCTLLAAYRRAQFDRLSAAARAHFDWLVGPKVRRQVRSGPFGLPTT